MTNLIGETVTHYYFDNGLWKPDVTGTVRAVSDNAGAVLVEVSEDATGQKPKGTLVQLYALAGMTERLMTGTPV